MGRSVGDVWRRQRDLWRAERERVGPATAALHRLRHLLGVADLDLRVRGLEAELAATRDEVSAARAELARVEAGVAVWETTTWLAGTTVTPDVLVSIVLPTCDRPALLARAIRSVLAQTYPRWELLVVDDGRAAAGEIVAAHTDARIRLLEGPRRGPGAARNVGLAAARGAFVTYLDDDNEMGPDWCAAVVWAFRQWPDTEVCYGARIFGDVRTPHPDGPPGRAALQLLPWDRAALEEANLADLGTLAHRRDLPEARFDEQLEAMVDWDLLLRLTSDRAPTRVPVLAVRYHVDAPDRISKVADVPGAIAQVLGKVHGRRFGADPAFDELLGCAGPGTRPAEGVLARLRAAWPSEWSAGTGYLAAMLEALDRTSGPVLECGSGLTTVLAATALAGSGRELWVLEHDPYWFGLIDGLCGRRGLAHVRRWRAPLVDVGDGDWYDLDRVRDPLPTRFGLVLCDGPPGTTRGGRGGLFRVLADRLRGALVLLDDAQRPDEAALIAAVAAAGGSVDEVTDGEARVARIRIPDVPTTPRLGRATAQRAE